MKPLFHQYLAGDTKMFVGDDYRYQMGKVLMSKIQTKNSIFSLVVYSTHMGRMGSN